MANKKKYKDLKIEEEIYLDFKDYKKILELQEKKDITFSELIYLLIKNKPIKLNKIPIDYSS